MAKKKISFAEVTATEKKACETQLEKLREALKNGDLKAYNAEKKVLDGCLKTLNGAMAREKYSEFSAKASPLIEAIRAFTVDVMRLKEDSDKETGVINSVSLEARQTKINLDEFVEFMSYDDSWLKDVIKLLNLLQLREIDKFNMSHDQLAKETLFFEAAYLEKKNGGTPDSKTKIIKMLQGIFDAVLATAEEDLSYVVTNRDLAFIEDAVTRYNPRGKCEIQIIKPRVFKAVMTDVLHHVITGEGYKVVAAKIKAE